MSLDDVQGLLVQLKRINPLVRETPGLPRQEILKAFSTIGLKPPAELVALFEWRNGIEELSAFTRLLSLKDALFVYNLHRELAEGLKDIEGAFTWQEQWFPVIDTNGDVQLCLDCRSLALALVHMEASVAKLICDSYLHYVAAVREGFSSQVFSWNDQHGYVEVKEPEWQALKQSHGIRRAYAR